MDKSKLTNWVEIDLSRLQKNIKFLENLAGCPMMAVVKANAYGHGLVQIALAAENIGIAWFGVARIEEALVLRDAGISKNILVLGYTPPDYVTIAQEKQIHLTVYDKTVAVSYSQLAANHHNKLNVHVKIDSGMGRLGVFPEDGLDFMRWMADLPNVTCAGVFTHFARADEPEQPATPLQIKRFDTLIQSLENADLRPPIVHASNSGATLCFPNAKYDMIRPGIIMYGMSPSDQVVLPQEITPILEWKTRLTSIKTLPPNHGVSYGHQYTTHANELVGALAIGYADGYRRIDGNHVLINGQRTDVIGRVCMDQTMVKITDNPDLHIGDEVVILGMQGGERISAEEIAQCWGTINYEVVAGIANRVNRVYL